MYTAFNGDAGKREIIRLAEESLPQSGGGMLHIMHKIRRDVDIHDNPVDIVLPMREHEWDKSLASFLSVFMDRREAQREKFKIFVKSQQVQPYVIARELAEGLNFTRQYNPDKKSAEKKFSATITVGFAAKDRNNMPAIDDSKPYGWCVCIGGMMVDAFQKFPQSRNTYKSTKESIIKGRKGIVAIAEIKMEKGVTIKGAGFETLPSKMSFMPTDAYRKLKDRMFEAVSELIKNAYQEESEDDEGPQRAGRGSGSMARAGGSGGASRGGARSRSRKSPGGGSKRKSRAEPELSADADDKSSQQATSRKERAASRRGEVVQELEADNDDYDELPLRASKRGRGVAAVIADASTSPDSPKSDATSSTAAAGSSAATAAIAGASGADAPPVWKALPLPTKKDTAIFCKVVTAFHRRAAAFGEQHPGTEDTDAKAFVEAEYKKLNMGDFDKEALFGFLKMGD